MNHASPSEPSAARSTRSPKRLVRDPESSFSALTAALTQPATSQAANAIQAIKNYIIDSHLGPGDPLPTEAQLCADLAISRSSVREAVRTLVALDIVEVRHGHGTFVGQASMRPMVESLVFRGLMDQGDDWRALREVVEVRKTLDLAMAESVTEAWRGRADADIDEAVAQMEALAAHGHTFNAQDQFFHSRLLGAVTNQLYRQLVEAFWAAHTITVPLLNAPRPEDIVNTARAHRAMLEAARAGDPAAYRQATIDHYEPLLHALRTS